jgi:hypothetical protein
LGRGVINYREQVALALRAAAVASSTSYSWFGHRSKPLPAAVTATLPAGGTHVYLVLELEDVLHRFFYSQGAPVPSTAHAPMPAGADPAFVDALSRCNTGDGGWQSGWRVEHVAPSGLVVSRDGLRVRVAAADCDPPRAARTAGASVNLRRPKEHRSASPGFYTALGNAAPAGTDELEVRVYFHVTAAGAAPLVSNCTHLLNRARVPFVLKVINNPAGFARCDAAVLYLGDGGFGRARAPLRAIVAACERYVRAEVPAFAKPLAEGIGVGEHHTSLGGSFGTSRCRLVAEAIVEAHKRQVTSLDGRLDAVARRFADRGLDLDMPYLAPASVDRYAL